MNNSQSRAYGRSLQTKGYQMEVFTGQDYCFNLFHPMIETETAAGVPAAGSFFVDDKPISCLFRFCSAKCVVP